jgi:hypothetical protein
MLLLELEFQKKWNFNIPQMRKHRVVHWGENHQSVSLVR